MARHLGRIHFPGNPWPAGHRIDRAVWSGRLDDHGLWFDLHLETAAYHEDDSRRTTTVDDDGDEDPPGGDWAAKIVWCNYHKCTLSSTKWRSDGGFLVGSADEPFDLDWLPGHGYAVDWIPKRATIDNVDGEDRPFQVYLLGHDTVAGHEIRFARVRGGLRIDWRGRIALTYAGGVRFDKQFIARVDRIRFSGFAIEPGLPREVATDLLALFTTDPRAYRRQGGRFVPRGG